MDTKQLARLAGRLMRHPSVAYHEHAVRAEVEKICREHGLAFQRDRFGNVLVRLQTRRSTRPLVLAAHMDHPGFEMVRSSVRSRWVARFLGGVPKEYFRMGVRLRLMPGAVAARLGRAKGEGQFEIRAIDDVKMVPRFAVWELDDFAIRNGRIHGRACDDLVGVASILATLIELKRTRAKVDVIGVISRAEEIGFRGALAVAAARSIPSRSLVISLETSRDLPGVKMGRGVILRVGDRTSIFDSEATRFLAEVGNGLQLKRPAFRFQRGLMSGGTCEATAYQEFGFQTAAVCVALGNYHNCAGHGRIEAEYVNVADACSMVDLLVVAAERMPEYSTLVSKLPRRLKQLLTESEKRLISSA